MIFFIVITSLFLAFGFFDRNFTIREFFRFFIGSVLSIFVLLVLLLVLTGLGQGITIIVKLFYSWSNILLTLALINFLALILSHFPYYFEVAISNPRIKWEKYPSGGPFGFVYHTDSPGMESFGIKYLRLHIGTLCYVIWIYILFFVNREIFSGPINIDVVILFLWLVLGLFQLYLDIDKNRINGLLKENLEGPSLNAVAGRIKNYLIGFEVLLSINVVIVIFFIFSVINAKWSEFNLCFLIVISFINALLYILFRVVRPWFVYYFNGDSMLPSHYFRYGRNLSEFKFGTFYFLKFLSSHIWYLVSMSVFGLLIGVFLLLINIGGGFKPAYINPVPLLIMFIVVYYSALVILLKHFIYTRHKIRDTESDNNAMGLRWPLIINRVIMVFSFAVLAFVILANYIHNDLHRLDLVSTGDDITIDKEEFLQSIDSLKESYVIMGSYGGGLKAHLWNLLVLNKLSGEVPTFLDATLCISGVSGGALGINSFYNGMGYTRLEDKGYWDYLLDTIGNSNSLSMDINGLLFSDLYREVIPNFLLRDQAKDRAVQSMHFFAHLIHREEKRNAEEYLSFKMTMQSYWASLFHRRGYLPAVIYNTTPTTAMYGFACSVDSMQGFPVSIDILDHDGNQSLSLMLAASTTNRFPIFSPAAMLPSKGHFVDGGYFENSGLMNALSFYEQLRKETIIFDEKRIYAINVVNDKTLYILDKFKEVVQAKRKDVSSGEVSSILKGIVALERMPNYMRHVIGSHNDSINLLNLHMPYIIDLNDLEEVFNAEKFDNEEELEVLIQLNNAQIIEALKLSSEYKYPEWGIVTPPLGRLLSIPAREYQRAMIEFHPEVQQRIKDIKDVTR